MAFHPQFNPLSFDQANPLIAGLLKGQQFGQSMQQFPLKQEILKTKAQYAPLTAQADAASKLAYANLMGPQFLAKLMGNTDILANIPANERNDALKLLLQSGTGQGTGQTALANPYLKQHLQQNNNGNGMSQNGQTSNSSAGYAYDNNGNNIIASPQEQTAIANNVWKTAEQIPNNREDQWAENVGRYKGTVKEGEETGKYIAEDLQDLGRQYDANLRLGDKFGTLTGLINDPEFQNLRSNIPFFQDKQLSVLSKIGTPQQQQMIGRFKNTAEEVVRDTINSFTGRILKGELDISRNMKINDNDTFNVMLGKVQSAMTYKDLNTKRIELAADIMSNEHISKMKALRKADKMIDSQSVIDNINKKLDYKVTVRNKKTGETEEIPASEARKRGIPNV
jgi:hypothetical protein